MKELDVLAAAQTLWPLIKGGTCVAWLGSGLSEKHYPNWPQTVDQLCLSCGVAQLPDANAAKAVELIAKAEDCKVANIQAYYATLEQLFGQGVKQPRWALTLLLRLPFSAYVTTNYDPALSCVAAMHRPHINVWTYPILPPQDLRDKTVFYIHGLGLQGNTPTGRNLVLAQSDFDTAYNGVVDAFLDPLLKFNPTVFLGCRLAEPEIYAVFDRLREIQTGIRRSDPRFSPPKRAVLVPVRRRTESHQGVVARNKRDLNEEEEDHRFAEMNIRTVRYEPSDSQQHQEVEMILERLCDIADTPLYVKPKVALGEVAPSL